MLGLGIAGVATFAAFHFASAARSASSSPLALIVTVLAWLDALALAAAALGLFG